MVGKTHAHKNLPEHCAKKNYSANVVGVGSDRVLDVLRRALPPAWLGTWDVSLRMQVGTCTYLLNAEG